MPEPAGLCQLPGLSHPGWEALRRAGQGLMGTCVAQELLALRLALEEGSGPAPGPPGELGFTKSSQAVQAVREALAAACASQRGQLRGLSGDEDAPHKPRPEGGCPSV